VDVAEFAGRDTDDQGSGGSGTCGGQGLSVELPGKPLRRQPMRLLPVDKGVRFQTAGWALSFLLQRITDAERLLVKAHL
jgi:hypothetical protein